MDNKCCKKIGTAGPAVLRKGWVEKEGSVKNYKFGVNYQYILKEKVKIGLKSISEYQNIIRMILSI